MRCFIHFMCIHIRVIKLFLFSGLFTTQDLQRLNLIFLVLLGLDNHRCHLTLPLVEIVIEHKIVLIELSVTSSSKEYQDGNKWFPCFIIKLICSYVIFVDIHPKWRICTRSHTRAQARACRNTQITFKTLILNKDCVVNTVVVKSNYSNISPNILAYIHG
jgi:hypothetical protein